MENKGPKKSRLPREERMISGLPVYIHNFDGVKRKTIGIMQKLNGELTLMGNQGVMCDMTRGFCRRCEHGTIESDGLVSKTGNVTNVCQPTETSFTGWGRRCNIAEAGRRGRLG